jgi:SAM-dependent methyltransferase
VTILGCSKGTEVYSISYAIRSVRGNPNIRIHALDISKEILEFAEAGIYSMESDSGPEASSSINPGTTIGGVATNTSKDQPSSIFERMSPNEIAAMFDREGAFLKVKPRYQEGISWHLGDAGDPSLVETLGLQDIVMANRFLCHMRADDAEKCLRNLARLVKPGGYLFISGVDLDVRSKVARELGWTPVTELIREIHEGDPSLRNDWPLRYWGLEPFDESRPDWKIRYSSVFRCGDAALSNPMQHEPRR